MKIYIASSWRNELYQATCDHLRVEGHDILDWRDIKKGGGFGWHEVTNTPADKLTGPEYRDQVLTHPRAQRGFNFDYGYMQEADVCVLLLPCGRSAHLEAGWFAGAGKPLIIFIPHFDTPELMYKLANTIALTIDEVIATLRKL